MRVMCQASCKMLRCLIFPAPWGQYCFCLYFTGEGIEVRKGKGHAQGVTACKWGWHCPNHCLCSLRVWAGTDGPCGEGSCGWWPFDCPSCIEGMLSWKWLIMLATCKGISVSGRMIRKCRVWCCWVCLDRSWDRHWLYAPRHPGFIAAPLLNYGGGHPLPWGPRVEPWARSDTLTLECVFTFWLWFD